MTSKTKHSNLSVTFHPEELYNLCDETQLSAGTKEEAFDRIREWLHRNKDDNTRLKEALTYQGGECNQTPLHNILVIQPPLDIVQNIINYAPEVLQMRNEVGCLPIYIACFFGASLEVIRALSIKVDFDDYLPLYLACTSKTSLDVLNFLIESYPDGIDQTPLDLLKEYAMETDNNGMLPLHHACNHEYSLHLIHLLIQAYPESTKVQDNDRYTPFHYLAKAASRVDDRGMLLLHREASHSKGLCVEALPFLLKANPEAIGLHDKSGLLPIHHASINEASSLDALMLLVKIYPESIAV